MLVQLPYGVYEKFSKYTNNGQSALLQDVKKKHCKNLFYIKIKG